LFIYYKIHQGIEQDSYTKANESGAKAQKETMGFTQIDSAQLKEGSSFQEVLNIEG